jgi:hypothetical protein
MRRALVGLVLVLAACTGRAIGLPMQGDAEAILAAYGLGDVALTCRQPTVGGQPVRQIACDATLTPAQAQALAKMPPAGQKRVSSADNACPDGPVVSYENRKVTNGVGLVEVHDLGAGKVCLVFEVPWSG